MLPAEPAWPVARINSSSSLYDRSTCPLAVNKLTAKSPAAAAAIRYQTIELVPPLLRSLDRFGSSFFFFDMKIPGVFRQSCPSYVGWITATNPW